MKIGILTLHEADSYGAVLQAYALQHVLAGLGSQGEFISFWRGKGPARQEEGARPAPFVQRMLRANARRSALFEAFRRNRLNCAPTRPWAEAKQVGDAYDRFIAGSDQVWNPRIPEVDERCFLPFAPPQKRFSYAASFGGEALPERLRAWCAEQLSQFAGLSVREESARVQVAALTGREASVCLDPTLLLDREDWDALTEEIPSGPYALLFLLKYDAQLAGRAREFADAEGMELRVVTASFMPQFGFEAWSGAGVERWISLIRRAECVFTNSFHGAVFSMIFGRPLCVALMGGALAARNGRIEELLRMTGMERCLAEPFALDREQFAQRLAGRRELSTAYLREVAANGAL